MPRYADAALQRRLLDERLLHRMQAFGCGQAFDGAYVRAVAHRGELQARRRRLAVDDDGADAARADAAAEFGAGELKILAQHVGEQAVAGL